MIFMGIMFVVGVFCLAASMAAHVSTFFNFYPKLFPPVQLLFLIMFVVLGTAILSGQKESGHASAWEIAPKWMRVMAYCLFAYGIFMFVFVNFVQGGGQPDIVNGKKALVNHGSVIKYLTDQEYKSHITYAFRFWSSWLMLFYSFGVTLLYGKIKTKAIKSFDEQEYS
jgi:hypothetical protein